MADPAIVVIQIKGARVLRGEDSRSIERLSQLDYRVTDLFGRNLTAYQSAQHIFPSFIAKKRVFGQTPFAGR